VGHGTIHPVDPAPGINNTVSVKNSTYTAHRERVLMIVVYGISI
jgi:hypothetical protein